MVRQTYERVTMKIFNPEKETGERDTDTEQRKKNKRKRELIRYFSIEKYVFGH